MNGSRADKVAAIQAALAVFPDLTWREHAARLGMTFSAYKNLRSDPDGAKQRARRERYEGTCVDCGGPTRYSGTPEPSERCDPCHRKHVEAEHGTTTRYQSGCRCEDCTRANREHHRTLKGKPPPTHGLSGYLNYGCRCNICRSAMSVKNRERYRERSRA